MKKAIGLDISYYDKTFNPKTTIYPLDFVIARAGHSYNNVFYEDTKFVSYFAGIKKVPIKLAYYYMNSNSELTLQVDEFLDTIGKADFEWDGFACKFSEAYNHMSSSFANKTKRWMDEITKATGKKVLLQIRPDKYKLYWQELGKDMPLWIVDPLSIWDIATIHSKRPTLVENAREGSWTLWQFNNEIGGYNWGLGRRDSGNINMFNGSVGGMKSFFTLNKTENKKETLSTISSSELHKLIKTSSELVSSLKKSERELKTMLHTQEELTAKLETLIVDDKYIKYTTLAKLTFREKPSTKSVDIGSVREKETVFVSETLEDKEGNTWGKIDYSNRTGWIILINNERTLANRI